MSALIIPCFLRTPGDVACLDRLMDSVRDQTTAFEHVYLVDDASPLAYAPKHAFVDRIVLGQNGGPARARKVANQKALAAGSTVSCGLAFGAARLGLLGGACFRRPHPSTRSCVSTGHPKKASGSPQ